MAELGEKGSLSGASPLDRCIGASIKLYLL